MNVDLTETYIDTVTGYLHVTLNELFKLKANYTVLEKEHEILIKFSGKQKEEYDKVFIEFTESEKKFNELSSVSNTNTTLKTEIEKLNIENTGLTKKAEHIDTFARQINENNSLIKVLNTKIEDLEKEVASYIEIVAQLKIDRDELKKLVPAEVVPISKKKKTVK